MRGCYSADGLILRTYRYGEADRIVVFLTEDRGKKPQRGQGTPRESRPGALALPSSYTVTRGLGRLRRDASIATWCRLDLD